MASDKPRKTKRPEDPADAAERRRRIAAEEGARLPTAGNPDSERVEETKSGPPKQPGPHARKPKPEADEADEDADDNAVSEAGRESFPASDPPSWTPGRN